MSEYKYLHHLKNHASSGIITKDGHTMFLQDVVGDITTLTQRNSELNKALSDMCTIQNQRDEIMRKNVERHAELVEAVRDMCKATHPNRTITDENLKAMQDCRRKLLKLTRVNSLI